MKVYNEYDHNQVELVKKKVRHRRKVKKKRIIYCLLLIGVIIFLFKSPYFQLQNIHVYQCSHEELKSEIEKEMNKYIGKLTLFQYFNVSNIEEELLKNKQVSSVDVKINFNGNIDIYVKEAEPIAYAKIEKTYYLINEKGAVVEDNHIDESLPMCHDYHTLDELKVLASGFNKITSQIRSDISDIIYIPKKYDSTLTKLILNNGHIIHIRAEDMGKWLGSESAFDYEANMSSYKTGFLFSFEGEYLRISKIKI